MKLSLVADNMTLHVENPKDLTKTLLELVHEAASYKMNMQKSVKVFYANKKPSKTEAGKPREAAGGIFTFAVCFQKLA